MRVLDTDTCIELLRGNRTVISRRAALDDAVSTTWITAGELYYGAARSTASEKNRVVVDQFLGSIEVLDLDPLAVRVFGETKAALESSGMLVPDADLLIGSIVLARGAVLVTGNSRHFGRIRGLRFENWVR